jgi:hypothetical protein
MNSGSSKKPLPFPVVLSWGFGLIFLNIFEKIHPFHPAVYTPLHLFLVNILPSLVTLAMILYGFTNPSYRKPAQTLLLIFSLWDMAGALLNTCDLWNLNQPQVLAVLKSWSFSRTLLKVYLQNLGGWLLDFWIGWFFLKKKPLGFEYPPTNPFQDVFMKFTGVLWILDSVYLLGLHSIVLLYKVMRML